MIMLRSIGMIFSKTLNFLLVYFYCLSFCLAQDVNEVFSEVENKGNVVVEWLTSGFFAFVIVVLALTYVVVGFLQGKLEWTRAITIIICSILIGQIPSIATWLIH